MKKANSFAFVSSFILLFFFVCCNPSTAQKASPPDKVSAKIGGKSITIDYCQPSVKGRKIWGELVPYGQVWRTGANEATTIEFDKDVEIEGKKLSAGKYSLFTIPTESDWTIIFNSDPKQWGAYKYEAGKDVLRVNVKPEKAAEFSEKMTFAVKNDKVNLMWENLLVSFKVK